MLDVRISAYVTPVAEQPQASLTPVIAVDNLADESAIITGLIRIYRQSTGLMIYSSELAITQLMHHTSTNIAALTPFDPPEPADDDYFVKADIVATSFLPGPPISATLGSYYFDIKTPAMGDAPAGHGVTHEDGGSDPLNVEDLPTTEMDDTLVLMPDAGGSVHWQPLGGGGGPHAASHQDGGADEISVAALSGLLADPQTPKTHKASHQNGGADELSVAGLNGELADPQPPKAHDTSHENGGADEMSVAGLNGELADPQPPKAHATDHEDGGADELEVSDLATSEADTAKVLKPDGAGGVAWGTSAGGRSSLFFCTDFSWIHSQLYSADPWSRVVLSGGSSNNQNGTPDHPGIVRITCAAAANSGARILTDDASFRITGTERTDLIFSIPDLADVQIQFGFFDSSVGTPPTDGAWAQISKIGGIDGTVQGHTADNTATSTTASSTTVAAGTWYRLKVEVNAAGTLVTFTLFNAAGATLWTDTLATNIPTGAGRECGHGVVAITKGTAATSLIDLDYMDVEITRTLTR